MTNSVDPDETDRYEPSHLDLHCLQGYLFWSADITELVVCNDNIKKTSMKIKQTKEKKKKRKKEKRLNKRRETANRNTALA